MVPLREMGRASYVVFDEQYSVAEIIRLLGVVVTDTCRPLDNFAPYIQPNEQLPFIDEYKLSQRTETNVYIKTSAIRDTAAEANIASIFGLSGSWSTKESFVLRTEKLRNVSLERYGQAFQKLIDLHGDSVRHLLRERDGHDGGYMLIGFKIAKAPTTKKETTRATAASAESSTEGIAAALGSPLPVNGSVSASHSTTREAILQSTTEDERVFAGLYVKLAWKVRGIEILPTGKIRFRRQVVQKGIAYPKQDKLAFARGDDSEEDSDVDEDEDETTTKTDALI